MKTKSGSGWESNPPDLFSELSLGLKPRAVTRSANTPEEILPLESQEITLHTPNVQDCDSVTVVEAFFVESPFLVE